MVRVTVFSAMLLGALGDDEASLLQANTGKKQVKVHTSTAQWVEEFASSPDEIVMRVASMQASERKSFLQQFASADASSLVKEIEPHKVALALALRQSPLQSLAKSSPSEWVSALQQRTGEIDTAISTKKPLRKKNDGLKAANFTTVMHDNNGVGEFDLVGGRCRDGTEFEDIEFNTACSDLCDSDDNCQAFETEEEDGEMVCKRFGAVGSTLNFAECQESCLSNENCTGFEFEGPSECELYEAQLDVEGASPTTEDGCYIKADSDSLSASSGERCRTGDEFADLTQSATCEALCDTIELCDSSEAEEEGGLYLCKRFTANLKSWRRTTLSGCAKRCRKRDECYAFEWDNGECELHASAVNRTLSTVEEVGDANACYMKNVTR